MFGPVQSQWITSPYLLHNSYSPQTEQHEPEGRMLFSLGNVTNLLDVTPSNQISHHYHLHPFHFVLFKVKDLVAKQHPTKCFAGQLSQSQLSQSQLSQSVVWSLKCQAAKCTL